jgi:hypothetical protein
MKGWFSSSATRNLILVAMLFLNFMSVLFVFGFVVPAYISEVNRGYMDVAKEHRLTQYENQLQWEAMLDKFFVLRCNSDFEWSPKCNFCFWFLRCLFSHWG